MVDGRLAAAEHNGHDHDAPSQPRPSKRGRGTSPPPNGTESTPAKRSRVSRACDQCRASREKCDGVKPVCHTCDSQKRSCTYDEPPKKRGIQPNYIRTLELTLAWLFQTVPETQAALSRSLPVLNGPAQRCVFPFNIVLGFLRNIACMPYVLCCIVGLSMRSFECVAFEARSRH
jgi:hypothetical protein